MANISDAPKKCDTPTREYKTLKIEDVYIDDSVNQAKRNAAHQAVIDHVKNSNIVGVGSGTTVVYAVEKLGELLRSKKLKDIKCVPSSYQARQLILQAKIPITSLDEYPLIDIYIDGADEVDLNLDLIKGGGGCLVQEKIVAYNAKKFIVIADCRKDSKCLGANWKQGIPIEVIPMAIIPVQDQLQNLKYGPGPTKIRMSRDIMGPARTDNGNFILDWNSSLLGNKDADWMKLYYAIKCIPGIVDVGLFLGMTHGAYFGTKDGNVRVRSETKPLQPILSPGKSPKLP